MIASESAWLQRTKRGVLIIIFMAGIASVLWGPIPLSAPIGRGDFIAYWSAAHLLAHSQNFSDPVLLVQTEQALAGWHADYAVKTWNPPWLLPILIPYTWVPFQRAVWLWFLTNIILVFAVSIMTWKACVRQPHARKWIWAAPVISILFVPILLLHGVVNRRWSFLLGFGGALAALTSIAFVLRPSFITEYAASAAASNLLSWATPTVGGILSMSLGWHWAKLIGVVILPLAILWWWRNRKSVRFPRLVRITLLVSVI